MFQHRHYVRLAAIIADLPDTPLPGLNMNLREMVADRFAYALRGTNANYSVERFYAAAVGAPQTGKDRLR